MKKSIKAVLPLATALAVLSSCLLACKPALSADTPDKVNPKELSQCAAAMAVMAYVVADMPESLPR